MTQNTNPTGYVDTGNLAPLNLQAYGGEVPDWQKNAVLIGRVWVQKDSSAKYTYTGNQPGP